MGLIIDCVADLHGNYPQLDGGDLLDLYIILKKMYGFYLTRNQRKK